MRMFAYVRGHGTRARSRPRRRTQRRPPLARRRARVDPHVHGGRVRRRRARRVAGADLRRRAHAHRRRRDRARAGRRCASPPGPPEGGYTFGLGRAEILSAAGQRADAAAAGGLAGYEASPGWSTHRRSRAGSCWSRRWSGIAVNVAATWCVGRANRPASTSRGPTSTSSTTCSRSSRRRSPAWSCCYRLRPGRRDRRAGRGRLMIKAGWGCCASRGRIFLEAAPAASTPTGSGATARRGAGVDEVHDLQSGRSPRASRRCRRTCSCEPAATATPPAGPEQAAPRRTGSPTPRCRSTTRRRAERSTARTRTARCTGKA